MHFLCWLTKLLQMVGPQRAGNFTGRFLIGKAILGKLSSHIDDLRHLTDEEKFVDLVGVCFVPKFQSLKNVDLINS